ncbi:MAG: VOC family protein [Gammaproteobacteria bacterium]|nr:VOC family protein [Gammaproteobacteria bacterium]
MSVSIAKDSIDLGLVTDNIDAMTAFYQDILGLELEAKIDMPGGATMTRLKCGTTIIKLVHPKKAPEASNPPNGLMGGTGIRYFTIHVDNMEDAVAECVKQGCRVPVSIQEVRPGITIAMIEDPDGNWVELLQAG